MGFLSKSKSEPEKSDAPTPADPAETEDGRPQRSVIEHRDFLLSQVSGGKPFGIGLLEVNGLTLCESLDSGIDLPVYTSATTAGWAVRASNLVGASEERPISLPVVGVIAVGGGIGESLIPGTAVRVEAGALVPDGADAVVAEADGTEIDDGAQFTKEVSFHENMRMSGSRIADGDPLLPSGSVLNPRAIAMLAEVGEDKVLALPKPRVVVGAVGSDLTEPGRPLTRLTQRYDAVTPMVTAAVRALDAHAFPIGILPGGEKELRAKLNEQLLAADLIVLSAADTPRLRQVLESLGKLDVADVAIQPAGPALFATIGENSTPVLVLPPQIVNAYVSFEVFGAPLVRKLAGSDPLERESAMVPVSEDIPADSELTRFIPGVRTSRSATPIWLDEHSGGVELAAVNSLIVVPPGLQVETNHEAICWALDQ
jgi:molybdopterin molybdotransferase